MPKKKQKKPPLNPLRPKEESDDDDTVSIASTVSLTEEKEEIPADDHTTFADLIDQLNEKRASTRETALQGLNEFFAHHLVPSYIEEREETIQTHLINSIRKGGPKETVLACRVFCYVCATWGLEADQMFKAFIPVLSAVIGDASKSAESRAAALEALGISCFLSNPIQNLTKKCMDVCEAHLKTGVPAITAQALKSWGLLATTVSQSVVAGSLKHRMFPVFLRLLDNKEVDVRINAGENIAYVYSAFLECKEPSFLEYEYVENSDELKVVDSSAAAKKGAVDINLLTEKLEELSTESAKYKAKKERVHQRAYFREFLDTLENGEEPSEALKLGEKRVQIQGWIKMKQLNSLRDVIAEGLQYHFTHNPLFGQIFGVQVQPDDKRTKLEKMADFEASERSNADYKKKQRRMKHAVQSLAHQE